jgi:hypothetical protein
MPRIASEVDHLGCDPPQGGFVHEEDSREEPLPELESSESVVPDVTGKSLLELLNEPDSDVAESVRVLLAQRSYRPDVVAGWNSYHQQ